MVEENFEFLFQDEPRSIERNSLTILWNSFTTIEENIKFWFLNSPRVNETFWQLSEFLHHGWRMFLIQYSEITMNEQNSSKFLWNSFTVVEEKDWILISENTKNERNSLTFLWNSFTVIKENNEFLFHKSSRISEAFWHFSELLQRGWRKFWNLIW